MTSGGDGLWRLFPLALLAAVGVLALIDTVNALTLLHDARARGESPPWWRPTVDEFSSGAVTLALLPLVWRAAMHVPPARPGWPWRLAFHAAASLVFAVLHVGGLIVVRRLAFAAVGSVSRYGGFSDLFYEYRKDLLVYGALLAAIWTLRALDAARRPSPPETAAALVTPPLELFEIREGARTLRVPCTNIQAARSAGNYVEFALADGRRPLMRTTLAAVESKLGRRGFVRTHRSWLVNAARVREIAPAGSGDHRLILEGGLEAPLSRRYPDALAQLRPT